jgi:hypothetical protein
MVSKMSVLLADDFENDTSSDVLWELISKIERATDLKI